MRTGNIISYGMFLVACLTCGVSYAQKHQFDTSYVRSQMEALCDKRFAGRGYVNKGDVKAAKYISRQFRKAGLSKFGNSWLHDFSFEVNSFPGSVTLTMCGNKYDPGREFLVHPASPSIKGEFPLCEMKNISDGGFLVLEAPEVPYRNRHNYADSIASSHSNIRGIVLINESKLTWAVARSQLSVPVIIMQKGSWDPGCESIYVDIDAEQVSHTTSNVVAYLEGSKYPDSFIVFTAHYDHLGMMGRRTMFPGANDNASGVAFIMGLAEAYASRKDQPECSLAFIAFAGEEAGLVGSEHYTRRPLFPLEKIRFLVNLDLMGTGEEGLMVVNGKIHHEEFHMLDSLNSAGKWFTSIGARGEAANSDHYHFSERGVPSFFIYALGARKDYHDVNDVPETLEMPRMMEGYELISSFITNLCR